MISQLIGLSEEIFQNIHMYSFSEDEKENSMLLQTHVAKMRKIILNIMKITFYFQFIKRNEKIISIRR